MKTILGNFMLPLFFAGNILVANAQNSIQQNGIDWLTDGTVTQEAYKGEACVKTDDGGIVSESLEFENGIIEFDMCIQQGRGFAGVHFRDDNSGTTEEFYVRKHQSGNPDAMQYTPVYNKNAGWQLYYGEGYGAVKAYVFDEWFHVKLVISGTKGEVYISDMETPVLVIQELKLGERAGKVGFYGPARFANIKVAELDSPELKGKFKTIEKAADNVIQIYPVSEIFNVESLINESLLPANFQKKIAFKNYSTEADGLLNISKTGALSEGKNAVLLKITINSETNVIKRMDFGFSDVAKIFVNGKAVWLGSDVYRSRDYRFLGTIGYFDSVYLDLQSGKNEIYVMVAENFGGWGFKARIENLNQIQLLQ